MLQITLLKVQIQGVNQDISKLPKGPWQFNSIEHMEGQLMIDAQHHGAGDIRVGYSIDKFVWSSENWIACEYEMKEV